jgi:hypothetical protein
MTAVSGEYVARSRMLPGAGASGCDRDRAAQTTWPIALAAPPCKEMAARHEAKRRRQFALPVW